MNAPDEIIPFVLYFHFRKAKCQDTQEKMYERLEREAQTVKEETEIAHAFCIRELMLIRDG
ncbi:hypothetical protein EEY24_00690 (plasmid) [Shewanella algae]|nr:hypothetical protein EEY24_00690 [Shewanella algae]